MADVTPVPEHKLEHGGDRKVNPVRKHLKAALSPVDNGDPSPSLSPSLSPSRSSEDILEGDVIACPDYPDMELHNKLEPVILEYFNSADAEECIESCLEIDDSEDGRVSAIVIAIEQGLQHKNEERALVSHLLVAWSEHVAEVDMNKAFDILLAAADDIQLDNPDAVKVIANFIGKAVADDILHPRFLHERRNLANATSSEIVETAHAMVHMRHGLAKLDNIWGQAGSRRSIKRLVESIATALREYVLSSDKAECERQIRELNVPHFHHEIVYESIVMSLEDHTVHPEYTDRLQALLAYFAKSSLITIDQLKAGFERVARGIDELIKDIPKADVNFVHFVKTAHAEGYLPQPIMDVVLAIETVAKAAA